MSSVVKLWPTSVAVARGLSRPPPSRPLPPAVKLPLIALKEKSSRLAEKLERSCACLLRLDQLSCVCVCLHVV
jgi:hypothetical protein